MYVHINSSTSIGYTISNVKDKSKRVTVFKYTPSVKEPALSTN
jgi:hypothetical protein